MDKINTNNKTVPQVLPDKRISASPVNPANESAVDVKKLYNDYLVLKNQLDTLRAENERLLKLVSENFSGKEHQFENTDEKDAFIKNIIRERDRYKAIAVAKVKENILNEIKKEFSDVTVASVDELPKGFHKLIAAKIEPALAYRVIMETEKLKKDKAPSSMGELNTHSEKEKEFYSSAEVDKLTKKQLSNPKIMNAVMKSMLKW